VTRHIMRGMRIDEEALALDVIHEAGPGGNFLASDHTVENFRREFFFPKLADRTKFMEWKNAGSPKLGERLRERVKDILATHEVVPLDGKVKSAIDEILKRSDTSRGEKHHELV